MFIVISFLNVYFHNFYTFIFHLFTIFIYVFVCLPQSNYFMLKKELLFTLMETLNMVNDSENIEKRYANKLHLS